MTIQMTREMSDIVADGNFAPQFDHAQYSTVPATGFFADGTAVARRAAVQGPKFAIMAELQAEYREYMWAQRQAGQA